MMPVLAYWDKKSWDLTFIYGATVIYLYKEENTSLILIVISNFNVYVMCGRWIMDQVTDLYPFAEVKRTSYD